MGRYTQTHSFALLPVSEKTFQEIKDKLRTAGYHDQLLSDGKYGEVIDMHGIGLVKEPDNEAQGKGQSSTSLPGGDPQRGPDPSGR